MYIYEVIKSCLENRLVRVLSETCYEENLSRHPWRESSSADTLPFDYRRYDATFVDDIAILTVDRFIGCPQNICKEYHPLLALLAIMESKNDL